MSDVTRILSAIEQGDAGAASQLLPLVYDELRKLAAQRMAHEQPGKRSRRQPWSTRRTCRLVGDDPKKPWDGRAHFFAAAAEAMRRILVDRARDRRRQKRGGGRRRVRIDLDAMLHDPPDDDLLALDEALQNTGSRGPGRSGAGASACLRGPDAGRGGRSHGHRPPHGRPLLGLCPRVAVRCAER